MTTGYVDENMEAQLAHARAAATVESSPLLRAAKKPRGSRKGTAALEGIISEMVADIGAEAVEAACREWCDRNVVRRYELTLKRPEMPHLIFEGRPHRMFPLLLALVEQGVNVCLSGEAGSGKTTAAISAAKTLGRPYVVQSFSKGTTKSDVLGYVPPSKPDATTYSPLRDAMTAGKVYVCDELDSADPGVLCILNSAIANREALFPDGTTIQAHKGFAVIAGINTKGTGATTSYRGRQAMDAATMDRFFFLRWDYDEGLELAVFGGVDQPIAPVQLDEGPALTPELWVRTVQKARVKAKELSLDHVISPRASEIGAKLIRAGIGSRHLISGLIVRGLPDDQGAKLLAALA